MRVQIPLDLKLFYCPNGVNGNMLGCQPFDSGSIPGWGVNMVTLVLNGNIQVCGAYGKGSNPLCDP